MSKKLVVRLAMAVAALSALTLLQGCIGEDDDIAYSFVWRSTGFAPASGASTVVIQVSSPGVGRRAP